MRGESGGRRRRQHTEDVQTMYMSCGGTRVRTIDRYGAHHRGRETCEPSRLLQQTAGFRNAIRRLLTLRHNVRLKLMPVVMGKANLVVCARRRRVRRRGAEEGEEKEKAEVRMLTNSFTAFSCSCHRLREQYYTHTGWDVLVASSSLSSLPTDYRVLQRTHSRLIILSSSSHHRRLFFVSASSLLRLFFVPSLFFSPACRALRRRPWRPHSTSCTRGGPETGWARRPCRGWESSRRGTCGRRRRRHDRRWGVRRCRRPWRRAGRRGTG